MEIKKEDVMHIAKLSMLNLSESEIDKYTKDLQGIVEFANTVNELDTSNTKASQFISDNYNVFRKDEIKESLDRKTLLENAPSTNGEAFSIPNIM